METTPSADESPIAADARSYGLRRTRVRYARAMTSQRTLHGQFVRALERGNLAIADALARDLPHVGLRDALRLCVLIAEHDPHRYDRAAVRRHGRFELERPPVTLPNRTSRLLRSRCSSGRSVRGRLGCLSGCATHRSKRTAPSTVRQLFASKDQKEWTSADFSGLMAGQAEVGQTRMNSGFAAQKRRGRDLNPRGA